MVLFGREVEINELVRIRVLSRTHARFTVVKGRRRVGKAELLEHVLNGGKMRYLRAKFLEEYTKIGGWWGCKSLADM